MAEHTMGDRLDDLHRRREEALHAGTERAVQRQHDKGKMLARERIDYFLDELPLVIDRDDAKVLWRQ